jgi:hypothetical protein
MIPVSFRYIESLFYERLNLPTDFRTSSDLITKPFVVTLTCDSTRIALKTSVASLAYL